MVFSPTELALFDLNGLVRTANLLRAAFQVYQQCLSAVRDHLMTGLMFALDLVDRFAAQDVAREVYNLLEVEITPLKQRVVPYGPRCRTPGSSYHPSTSPPETVLKSRICVPGHITTAGVILHVAGN